MCVLSSRYNNIPAIWITPLDVCVSNTIHVSICSTRGYYQLDFKGLFNMKPIPGPSVNVTIIPDPNKPVSLLVEYDTKAKIPAGGKFPGMIFFSLSLSVFSWFTIHVDKLRAAVCVCLVFRVTVVSEEGSPLTKFNPAAASMWLWQGRPSARSPPSMVSD